MTSRAQDSRTAGRCAGRGGRLAKREINASRSLFGVVSNHQDNDPTYRGPFFRQSVKGAEQQQGPHASHRESLGDALDVALFFGVGEGL